MSNPKSCRNKKTQKKKYAKKGARNLKVEKNPPL
jgi:hypothetical protein